MRSALILCNPLSGRRRTKVLLPRIAEAVERAGFRADVRMTQGPEQSENLLGDRRTDLVVVVGGDGTVNDVIHGMQREQPEGRSCPLALFPMGTANVLAKELKLPRNVPAFARMLRAGKARRLDLLRVTRPHAPAAGTGFQRQFSLLMASAGFDAFVVEEFHRHHSGPKWMWDYLRESLVRIPRYEPPRLEVEIDGKVVSREARFVLVGNVRKYGGPFCFACRAVPDDGLLDLVWYEAPGRVGTLKLFFTALAGSSYQLGGAYYRRGKRAAIRPLEPGFEPLQIDGDPGGYLPAEFEVLPTAAAILVPTR